jgi:hypothetical protein
VGTGGPGEDGDGDEGGWPPPGGELSGGVGGGSLPAPGGGGGGGQAWPNDAGADANARPAKSAKVVRDFTKGAPRMEGKSVAEREVLRDRSTCNFRSMEPALPRGRQGAAFRAARCLLSPTRPCVIAQLEDDLTESRPHASSLTPKMSRTVALARQGQSVEHRVVA